MLKSSALLTALTLAGLLTSAHAADTELNLYTARHYQTDEALYENFTKTTGIRINRIEGKEDELLERISNEAANSPADVFITVDAARLAKADELGIFAPLDSKLIEERIAPNLRTDTWAAFSVRARVIVHNKLDVKPDQVRNYEDLAKPALKGLVCTRSGSHPYNLSLGAAMIQHNGTENTEKWARGIVANFARQPKGGDTDQIRAVGAGECGVAIANSYYVARLINSSKPDDRKTMEAVGVIWPNQQSWGTHINVSGGGMLKHAPTRKRRASSSNTSPPTRPRLTSQTATMNGRWSTASRSTTQPSSRWAASRWIRFRSENWRRPPPKRRKSTIAPVIAERHESPEA